MRSVKLVVKEQCSNIGRPKPCERFLSKGNKVTFINIVWANKHFHGQIRMICEFKRSTLKHERCEIVNCFLLNIKALAQKSNIVLSKLLNLEMTSVYILFSKEISEGSFVCNPTGKQNDNLFTCLNRHHLLFCIFYEICVKAFINSTC